MITGAVWVILFNRTVDLTRDHVTRLPKQPDPSIDVTLRFFPIMSRLLLPLCVVLTAARASLFPIGGNTVLLLLTDLLLVEPGASAFVCGGVCVSTYAHICLCRAAWIRVPEPVCEDEDPAGADIGAIPTRG